MNPAKVGLGLTAIIRFKASKEPYERIFAIIKACPEIIECHDVTGDDCMTLIARLTPYGASNTSIVLSSPLRHRVIGPAALLQEQESA